MKALLFLVSLGLVFFISACQTTTPVETIDPTTLIELTLEELSAFDGREGRKAYIAVNGNIYDVTNSPRWPNGNHNGFQAGQDLTDPILNQSPHGLSTLDGVPLIGILVESNQEIPIEDNNNETIVDDVVEDVVDDVVDDVVEDVVDDVVDEENDPDDSLIKLTLEELSAFDGLEGRKAYIAVNGNIYDVTNSSRWPNGNHNGYQAGQDLTDPIMNQSPHGLSTLDGVPLIGILVENQQENDPDDSLIKLTLEELSAFDGLEGRKAYIAVNGNIYDVTNSSRWPNGNHNGYQAGQDLTDPIMNQSPHGLSTLDGVPLIGILVESHQEEGTS